MQAEALLPGRFLFQRPFQRCFLLHPSHPLFFLELGPSLQGTQACSRDGKKTLPVSCWWFLLVEIGKSNTAIPVQDLLLHWAWCGRRNQLTLLLLSSALLHTVLTPSSPPCALPAPTFLILCIIKWPRVLWDPLILFAILCWGN